MKIKKMDVEFKYGRMDQDMMVSGEMEWQMVTEDSFMLKVMSMKVNGLKTKLTDMVFTLILMEAATKDNGIKISSMVMVLNNGQMVLNMKDSMNKE